MAETTTTTRSLLATDRCDRCGAQALVETLLGTLQLLWCGHHYRDNEAALADAGAFVLCDDRQAR